MKIVMLTDLDVTGDLLGNLDTSDSELFDIYNIGEYDSADGYVQFMSSYGQKCGWYIGCAPGVKIDFNDGTSIEFTELQDDDYVRDNDKISAAIAELRRIVFSHDTEDPATDMPDIF